MNIYCTSSEHFGTIVLLSFLHQTFFTASKCITLNWFLWESSQQFGKFILFSYSLNESNFGKVVLICSHLNILDIIVEAWFKNKIVELWPVCMFNNVQMDQETAKNTKV